MSNLYIGLMSGTSADGIDAVLADFSQTQPHLLATHYTPYTPALRQQVLDLCKPGENEIHRLGELDILLAKAFAEAVSALLAKANISADKVAAIGSHGQTIRHAPNSFTLQIGDPNTIAALTGINTIADFRRKDVALGGQGAPLVPAFHQHVFANARINRAIVNIGGIANVTLLPNILGFDTGPGNALMDEWIKKHLHRTHDEAGAWAATGKINTALLHAMRKDAYFELAPPKSTGREYFNQVWLNKFLDGSIAAEDVQATLTELTATTIVEAVQKFFDKGELYICGGGAHNQFLLKRLTVLATPNFSVKTTETLGVHPDWVEALAFAWLAYQTNNRRTGNVPSVTGAEKAAILGGVYYA